MANFLVLRSGPQWDPSQPIEEQSDWPAHAAFMDDLVDAGVMGRPLADEHRVVLAIEAESQDAVRATLARDPWIDTHLRITIDPWTIRLDGRHAEPGPRSSPRVRPPLRPVAGRAPLLVQPGVDCAG